MKVDDDTYLIVENLRYFLSDKNASFPVYFGLHFHAENDKYGYHSGGAGYVLSREALSRFAHGNRRCKQDNGPEDYNMGVCMGRLGVELGDSRDARDLTRFHCFNIESQVEGAFPQWFLEYEQHGAKGVGCLANAPWGSSRINV